MRDWIEKLFSNDELTGMGHLQRTIDQNLGLGWLYYSLVRIIRPTTVVVIGSYRGFTPLVFGKALADNLEQGNVYFIDPSLVDDFWKQPAQVKDYFARYGVTNVVHFPMTTQQFVQSQSYQNLGEVGVVFVDGYHSFDQAKFDYEAFCDHLSPEGVVLFHDSIRVRTSRIYGPQNGYEHRVKDLIDMLGNDRSLQVFDMPFSDGVTMVRKRGTDGVEDDG